MAIDTAATPSCGCGLDEPTFPRTLLRGDRCPIGPLQLHHWHGELCMFCGGVATLDAVGDRHYANDSGEPLCCGEPMIRNTGGWYECADAYFWLDEERLLGDCGDLIEWRRELTQFDRDTYEHWKVVRVMTP